MDDIELYDYELPPELIAKHPTEQRDASRLMLVDCQCSELAHRAFTDLPDLLSPGDLLVMNNSRVIPARLVGFRTATEGKWEGLFLNCRDDGSWRLLSKSRGKIQAGETITVVPLSNHEQRLLLKCIDREEDGTMIAVPESDNSQRHAFDWLQDFGSVPLPPYMEREQATDDDWNRYQTTYAAEPGSVAAPTAGLHFTDDILARCTDRGIDHTFVTLHVGIGTFRPIATTKLSEHKMHSEWCEISSETAAKIDTTKENGGRVIAVGTTSVRTLESAAQHGPVAEWRGDTDIFIRPPYDFRIIDGLITNFHLPKSTLFVLVSTLANLETMQRAYAAAIKERYRFYSYGDAMLILP